jgi:hypothetical protein
MWRSVICTELDPAGRPTISELKQDHQWSSGVYISCLSRFTADAPRPTRECLPPLQLHSLPQLHKRRHPLAPQEYGWQVEDIDAEDEDENEDEEQSDKSFGAHDNSGRPTSRS